MRWWICVVPLLVLAACSNHSRPSNSAAVVKTNPEPVERVQTVPPPERLVAESAPAAEAPALAAVVIPRGSVLRVRIDQALDTRRNRAGDHFYASLAAPVLVHGSRNAIWALSGEAPGWEPPLAPSPAGERAH